VCVCVCVCVCQMDDVLVAIDEAAIAHLSMSYIRPMLLGETGSKVCVSVPVCVCVYVHVLICLF